MNIGIIGAGWRTLFFMRIIKAYPDRYTCTGVVVRNPDKRQAFAQEWDVPVFASLDDLLDANPVDYVIVSTSENHTVIQDVARRGVPCLAETPPARTEDELLRVYETVKELGGKIQIAEQYHLRPHHQAQMSVLNSGKIGPVSQVQASVAHGYHGMSMIRRFLGIGFENAVIRSTGFTSPIVKGADRSGVPDTEQVVDAEQVHAWFHFENGKMGILDFTNTQYRGWIRKERLLVRGERGEISNEEVRYLKAHDDPQEFSLERVTHGQEQDLKMLAFVGYRGEGEWHYRTPFGNPILMDDEIAMAHCMDKMLDYVQTGQDFYSLEEASQDTYLGILYERALAEDKTIESKTQIWADS